MINHSVGREIKLFHFIMSGHNRAILGEQRGKGNVFKREKGRERERREETDVVAEAGR